MVLVDASNKLFLVSPQTKSSVDLGVSANSRLSFD